MELGWTCTPALLPNESAYADKCERCADDLDWRDAQGFACEDYVDLAVCDKSSVPTDPARRGGRFVQTPRYHKYIYVLDLRIREQASLLVEFQVKATKEAHVFLGRPRKEGLEVVLGGDNNTHSMIRRYPGMETVAESAGKWLNATGVTRFWLHLGVNGTIVVGHGAAPLPGVAGEAPAALSRPLDGVPALTAEGLLDASAVDRLSLATGWQAGGAWELRVLQGAAAPTIRELANMGKDALAACCACGGGDRATLIDLLNMQAFRRVRNPTRKLSASIPAPPVILGAPKTDGFAMHIRLQGCGASAPCVLHGIVAPYWASAALHAWDPSQVALESLWVKLPHPDCALRGVATTAEEVRWEAFECGMASGGRYIAVVHLEGSGTAFVDFQIPRPLQESPQDVGMVDEDPAPMRAAGIVNFTGFLDESAVAQYRFYWDRFSSRSTSSEREGVAALAGFVNTYAGGGLRNGFRNGCLLDDCHWVLRRTAENGTSPRFALWNEQTGECICRRPAPMRPEACPPGIFAPGDDNVSYDLVGSGALVSEANEPYVVAQYRSFASTVAGARRLLEEACADQDACVGYVVHSTASRASGVVGGLCLDAGLVPTAAVPPAPVLVAVGGVLVGTTASMAAVSGSERAGEGPPVLDRTTSDLGDLRWSSFTAYAKRMLLRSCLWRLEGLDGLAMAEDGDAHSVWDPQRLVSIATEECLCQVPSPPPLAPDGERIPAASFQERQELRGDRRCSGSISSPALLGADELSAASCSWTSRPADPRRDAVLAADPAAGSPVAVVVGEYAGAVAWQLKGTEAVPLSAPRTVPASHSHAAWVFFRELPAPDNGTASWEHRLFASTGVDTSAACLSLSQRVFIDDVVAECPNANSTPPDAAPQDDAAANRTGLPGDRWAMGLRACSSPRPWDSGADLVAPTGEGGWALLVAVGSADSGETVFYASEPTPSRTMYFDANFSCVSPAKFGAAAWMTYGCTATASLRDIPRQEWRQCLLDVFVDSKPELFQNVESIVMRGRVPELAREIPKDCSVKQGKSLRCVSSHVVDDIVLGSGASRNISVDVAISAAEDAPTAYSSYLHEGAHLSGRVRISCAPRRLAAPLEAPGTAMRQVGVAGRTCAGERVEALAATTANASDAGDPAVLHVAQAWAWDRSLSKTEIDALFHATRPRYSRRYTHRLPEQPILLPASDWRASATMSCAESGCIANTTFRDVPPAAHWICYFSVQVAITDFSTPTEVVEYIRIGGVDVVTDCWPGRESLPTSYFVCADGLEVPGEAIGTGGDVQVFAKISAEVDNAHPHHTALLDAVVELRCAAATEVAERYSAGNESSEQDVALLATAANDQGEGPARLVHFVDRVNAFLTEPQLHSLTSDSVGLSFDATDEDGSVWLYVALADRAGSVAVADVVGGAQDWDVCPRSHRRRGPARIAAYRADPVLSSCGLEAGVSYGLLAYVDQALPPFIGGTLRVLDVVGPVHTAPTRTPARLPLRAAFEDEDPLAGRIGGTLRVMGAFSEDDINGYTVFMGDANGTAGAGLGSFAATGADVYNMTLSAVDLAPGVDRLLVFAYNSYGTALKARHLPILDLSIEFVQAPTVHIAQGPSDSTGGTFEVTVRFRVSVRGSSSDIVVVPAVMEGDVEPKPDHSGLNLEPLRATLCSALGVASPELDVEISVGPCTLAPGLPYAVIVFTRSSLACPCAASCQCLGAIAKAVTGGPGFEGSGNETTVVIRDGAGPASWFSCGEGCIDETEVMLTALVRDAGHSYPAVVLCAACTAGAASLSPSACLRPEDVRQRHRFWRLAFPSGSNCTYPIAEVEFYSISNTSGEGLLMEGSPITSADDNATGTTSFAIAFDGDTIGNVSVDLAPSSGQSWIGLDLGNSTAAALWARIFYDVNFTGDCRPDGLSLQWSDDASFWISTPYSFRNSREHDHADDVFLDISKDTWHDSTQFQVAFLSEAVYPVTVSDLSPGSTYDIYCYVEDARGNGARAPPLTVQTTCPLGWIADRLDATGGCTACLGGSISWTPESRSCTPCAAGRFAAGLGNTACSTCSPGTYAPPGSPACIDCAPGFHMPLAASGWCLACPVGRYSPSGSLGCIDCAPGRAAVDEGTGECENCTAGRYAEARSPACFPCAFGRFASHAESSACDVCSAGRSSADGAAVCDNCTAGRASLAGENCMVCEAGTFSLEESEFCEPCPAGRFSDADEASECAACDSGSFSSAGSTNCIECEPGTFSLSAGIGVCVACEAGSFSPGGNQSCTPCPTGHAAPNASGLCTPCGNGSFVASDKASCEECPPGRAAAGPANTACELCGAGRFAPEGGVLCEICVVGRFSAEGSGECELCPIATYSAEGSGSCTLCALGRAADEGSGSCEVCLAGTFAVNGSANCTQCPGGRYSSTAESTECLACGAGTAAAPGSAACADCPAGRAAEAESGECAVCPAGSAAPPLSANCSTCDVGRFAPEGSAACEECAPGFVAPAVGTGACAPCVAGRFVAASGSTACDICDNGTSAVAGSGNCTECAAGRFAIAGDPTCQVCSAGTAAPLGSMGCEVCAAGRFAAEGSGECTTCGSGRFATIEADQCGLCPRGRSAAIGYGGVAVNSSISPREPAVIESCVLGHTLDGSSTGHVYDGHGALSAGGASRLLYDYPEPYRSEILDYLFLPGRGASLHMLKVEIPGDSQSGYGTEPSHMHQRGESSCGRGVELWLIREARRRNPRLVAYGLCFTVPSWIGGPEGTTGGFYSQDLVDYLLGWLQCARDVGAGEIEYIGNRNQRDWGPPEWIVSLRDAMDAAGFARTSIVIPDGAYDGGILDRFRRDANFSRALSGGGVAVHYPCYVPRPEVTMSGLKYWASEEQGIVGNWSGAACWGRTMNRNFVRMNITSSVARSALWSVYTDISAESEGLVDAFEPWSGHYALRDTVWITAHTTQFVEVGWLMLDVYTGSSGPLVAGGSFVTFVPPSRDRFVLVVEKLHGECRSCEAQATEEELLRFVLFRGLELTIVDNTSFDVNGTIGQEGGRLELWMTNRTHHFMRLPDLVVDPETSSFNFSAQPDAIYTVASAGRSDAVVAALAAAVGGGDNSTNDTANDSAPVVPARRAFPAVHEDNFDDYPIDASPAYFADLGGSWQVAPDPTPNAGDNLLLKQWVDSIAGDNVWAHGVEPMTVIGTNSSDLVAQVDVLLPEDSAINETQPPLASPHLAIRSAWTGDCIAATGKELWPGAALAMKECSDERAARFAFDAPSGRLRAPGSAGLCVAARSWCGEAGGLCLAACASEDHQSGVNPFAEQRWLFSGDGALRLSADPGLCVTAPVAAADDSGASSPGLGLRLAPCSGAADERQRWVAGRTALRRYGGLCVRLAPPRGFLSESGRHPPDPLGYCVVVTEVVDEGSRIEGSGSSLGERRGLWQLRSGGEVLAAGRVAEPVGAWHRLRISASGTVLRVGINEQTATTVDTSRSVGMVALISSWGEAYFDNFALLEPDG